MKRSAFGRLSGRQRPDADEVEGDERQQRRGNGAPASVRRTTGPLRGTRYASSFSVPYASAPGGKAGAACLRDIPFGNVVSRWTLVETPPSKQAFYQYLGTSGRQNGGTYSHTMTRFPGATTQEYSD